MTPAQKNLRTGIQELDRQLTNVSKTNWDALNETRMLREKAAHGAAGNLLDLMTKSLSYVRDLLDIDPGKKSSK